MFNYQIKGPIGPLALLSSPKTVNKRTLKKRVEVKDDQPRTRKCRNLTFYVLTLGLRVLTQVQVSDYRKHWVSFRECCHSETKK